MNAVETTYANVMGLNADLQRIIDRIGAIWIDTGSLRGLRGKAYSEAANVIAAEYKRRRDPLDIEASRIGRELESARRALAVAKAEAGLAT